MFHRVRTKRLVAIAMDTGWHSDSPILDGPLETSAAQLTIHSPRSMKIPSLRFFRGRALTALCSLSILGLSPSVQAGTPNSGFAETTLITSSSLTLITHMAWAPDGSNRLFVARKG